MTFSVTSRYLLGLPPYALTLLLQIHKIHGIIKKGDFMDTNDLVKLLPSGYEQACFDKKAITRKRTIKNPLDLLRLILFYTTLQDYEIKPCRRNSDIKASIMLFDFIVVSMFCTKVAKNTCSRICLLRINRNSWALSPRYFAKSFS